jgi:hypothetical protein
MTDDDACREIDTMRRVLASLEELRLLHDVEHAARRVVDQNGQIIDLAIGADLTRALQALERFRRTTRSLLERTEP